MNFKFVLDALLNALRKHIDEHPEDVQLFVMFVMNWIMASIKQAQTQSAASQ